MHYREEEATEQANSGKMAEDRALKLEEKIKRMKGTIVGGTLRKEFEETFATLQKKTLLICNKPRGKN